MPKQKVIRKHGKFSVLFAYYIHRRPAVRVLYKIVQIFCSVFFLCFMYELLLCIFFGYAYFFFRAFGTSLVFAQYVARPYQEVSMLFACYDNFCMGVMIYCSAERIIFSQYALYSVYEIFLCKLFSSH